MSRSKIIAVASAVVLFSSVAGQAATSSHKPAHSMTHKTMGHGTMARGKAVGADNSADALNAQSLARSQAPAQ